MANEKRLIDVKPLMEDGWHLVKTGKSNVFLASMSLADVPTVDAVEVPCRCKECIYWRHYDHIGCNDFAKVCTLANYMIGARGYCLYGKRKGDGNG